MVAQARHRIPMSNARDELAGTGLPSRQGISRYSPESEALRSHSKDLGGCEQDGAEQGHERGWPTVRTVE